MNETLKGDFFQHLKNMIKTSTNFKRGLEEFYQLHGTKEAVFKELKLLTSDTEQERLNQLFPNEFILHHGVLTLNVEYATQQALEKHIRQQQSVVRQFYLQRNLAKERHSLTSISKKSNGKKCPTCGVIMKRGAKGNSKLTVEHIVPLSCGGDNSTSGQFPQCVGMCHLCNQTRNVLVCILGKKDFGTQNRLTDTAVRFLITQVYAPKTELDQELNRFFWERYNLAIRVAESKDSRYPAYSQPQQNTSYSPADDSLLRILEDADSGEPVPKFNSNSREFVDAAKRVDSIIKFGQLMTEFERQLRERITEKNSEQSMFSFDDLQSLVSSLGKEFIEVTGVQEQGYDVFLYRNFENEFIVQSVEDSKVIHIAELEEEHSLLEVSDAEPLHEFSLDEFAAQNPAPIQKELPKVETSKEVQFFRSSIEQHIPTEGRSSVNIDVIRQVVEFLCNLDGMELNDYMNNFDISIDDELNLQLISLLRKNGFDCRLQVLDGAPNVMFTLPHPFAKI